ncbi:retinol dehydrogenase 8-like [Lytechinus variegatus]|uniref:retinol dehydrogenase 8-like n=1 Tax=Lytechinus variegatus TaxID=7654 RepID=UPI001BB1881A|nr:retinol dehydrogenase 8-like [Lytechinus variegatus]
MAQKITLITGCSSGIGLNLAVKLGKDAAKKYLVYSTMRNLDKKGPLQEAADSALNDTMFIRPLDVVSDESVKNAVNEIIDEHGRIDIVVNNAGIATFNPIEYSSIGDIRDVVETNFFGPIRVIQAVLPHMKDQRSGHIVNVSSITGLLGLPFYETYSASKHAVEGLTEALAIRMKSFNVKLSSVIPGLVDTEMNSNIVVGNRLPSKVEVDPLTREQLKILRTHVTDYFENTVQTSDEVCDVIQNVIETGQQDAAIRFKTSDVVGNRTSMKMSDFGGSTWLEFARKMVEDPIMAYLSDDESQI